MERISSQKKINNYLSQYSIMESFSFHPEFKLYHYSPGEIISGPFEEVRALQFIVEGEILVYEMPTEESFFYVQTPYLDAKMIGEVELVDPDFQSGFVEAKTDVYTLALPLSEYRERLINDPVFLLTVCRTLSRKLNGIVKNSYRRPLKEQVTKYIINSGPGGTIHNIDRFASLLNVSSRQLLRVLKDLCEEGYLEHPQKGSYIITDKCSADPII